MLVNFRFENFLSIDNMITFSMVPGKTRMHSKSLIAIDKKRNLLKISAIYGANAAGKSSFVKAMSFSQYLILKGFEDRNIFLGSFNKNNEINKDKETKFDFEIVIDGKVYSYGFSVLLARRIFTQEWLYDITQDEKLIYTIDKNNQVYNVNFSYLNLEEEMEKRLDIYADDNLHDNNQLFLSSLQDGKKTIVSKSNDSILKKIFEWFYYTLEVLEPGDEAKGSIPSISFKGEEYKVDLGKYLELNDTGVIDIVQIPIDSMSGVPAKLQERMMESMIERSRDKKVDEINSILKTKTHIYILKYQEDLKIFELKFKHKNGSLYSLYEESDGTVRLVELFFVLFNRRNKVFIIDEIDRSLHPLLTYNFIESFISKKDSSQLVVTTHEDLLLDFSLLRRDEIWFIDKDIDGNSSLYSLEEFKERFDKNISNAYLDGRYGGVPKLRNLFTNLINDSQEV